MAWTGHEGSAGTPTTAAGSSAPEPVAEAQRQPGGSNAFRFEVLYPGVAGVEGTSVAVQAALLQDVNSNQLGASRQQEERDGCQHVDLVHVGPGLI